MDRRLDRLVEFDERSRAFPARTLVDSTKPRSYAWACGVNLDQGSEGACVGFAWTHERAAKPKPDLGMNDLVAQMIYTRARQLDEWPGQDYDGTSVLAGAKTCVETGWFEEYRWAFSTNEALAVISRHGPAVIGINWYESMFHPNEDGFLKPEGGVAGGHAILVRGVNVKHRYVVLHNSWGQDWGGTAFGPGTALLSWDDLERLLGENGECCIPVHRA